MLCEPAQILTACVLNLVFPKERLFTRDPALPWGRTTSAINERAAQTYEILHHFTRDRIDHERGCASSSQRIVRIWADSNTRFAGLVIHFVIADQPELVLNLKGSHSIMRPRRGQAIRHDGSSFANDRVLKTLR